MKRGILFYCTHMDNTALSSRTPTLASGGLLDNTALPSVGGYVRRVKYYPCECSKNTIQSTRNKFEKDFLNIF